MTPQIYCARLERALSLMPAAERQETIRYYLEFLEDASEEERAALGTPEALAQQILRENGISPQPAVIKHSNRTAKLIVLACTFYIWLPLLVTWYSLLLTALIVLICIPVSLGAALLGWGATGSFSPWARSQTAAPAAVETIQLEHLSIRSGKSTSIRTADRCITKQRGTILSVRSRLPLFPSDSDVTLTLPAEQFAQLKQALQTTERSN